MCGVRRYIKVPSPICHTQMNGVPQGFSNKTTLRWLFIFLLLLVSTARLRAAIQFDAFVGYDSIVRDGSWFPVTFELFNDGPAMAAVIEIAPPGFGNATTYRIPIDLTSNTRKRLVVPMFGAAGRFNGNWDARLVTADGKVRAERLGIPIKVSTWGATLLGALPKTFSSIPVFPELKVNRPEIKPSVARLQPEQFPDNPLALEGLDALYLNSERAAAFSVPQATALLAWVRGGGHLIVAVEQMSDLAAAPWLSQFLPVEILGSDDREILGGLRDWVTDPNFVRRKATLLHIPGSKNKKDSSPESTYASLVKNTVVSADKQLVGTGRATDGRVLAGSADAPLIVEAVRARGTLTVLMFSPEREPFRSWSDRGVFWAKLCEVSPELWDSPDFSVAETWSSDGVFGAMLDSRQVRKLPIGALLLLLLVYLAVIGPVDYLVLKRLNRQMLTWITFPAYVVFFSVLIYIIGYQLRAGDTEWNELQVVDVLPRGEKADLRGRTYFSVYASKNSTFPLGSDSGISSLRAEMVDLMVGAKDGEQPSIIHRGNNFSGTITVPVWTSSLYVEDWFKTGERPIAMTARLKDGQTEVEIRNLLDRKVTDVRVVVKGLVYEVGVIEAGATRILKADGAGQTIAGMVRAQSASFRSVVQSRRNPLGDEMGGRLDNPGLNAMLASFTGLMSTGDYGSSVFAPAGMDLSEQSARGDIILFALDSNSNYTKRLHQFTPPRQSHKALLRYTLPAPRNS